MKPLPVNARLFVWFRVLFNARFYYPILAVFFVDVGLTLDQYAILNVAWALSIVACELPLGALGDQIGRRPLIIGAGVIMLIEMGVLSFANSIDRDLLFWIFIVNRILSGAAEAAASGADEALAYDSMVEADRVDEWPRVLTVLGRAMSGSMFVAMIIGAVVYDASLMEPLFGAVGIDLPAGATVRFPAYLCLGLAVGALLTAVRMKEVDVPRDEAVDGPAPTGTLSLRDNWRGILAAGRWIVQSRFALVVILFSLTLDSVTRLFMTMTSTYFRIVDIPARWFGVLSAGFAAIGMIAPELARRLVAARSPVTNFVIVALLMLAGLLGIAFIVGWVGVAAIAVIGVGWHLLGFFTSHYLNAVTSSSRRATVLSFKSLAGNLAYGFAGWTFAFAIRHMNDGVAPEPNSAAESASFLEALRWVPVGFVAGVLPLVIWATRSKRMCAISDETSGEGRSPSDEPPSTP